MGTSTTVNQFTGKLERLAKEMNDPTGALNVVGLQAKNIFLASAASAGAAGKTVSGKRKPIGARYDLKGKRTKGLGQGQMIVTYTGPAHLLNNPTSRHFIGARRLGSRRRLAGRAARVGATAAFGGSNRGAFGALLAAERTTRSGAVRSNGKAALTIGANLRAYAFHPGTKGKHFFEAAREIVERTAPATFGRAQLTEPLRRIF